MLHPDTIFGHNGMSNSLISLQLWVLWFILEQVDLVYSLEQS